jgi:putative endonuclease
MLDFILKLLTKLAGAGKDADTQPEHLQTGIEGEEAAAKFIRKDGYSILAQRWKARTIRGDLDLIAIKDGTLCFIEVKTRTAHDSSPAERTVNAHKRRTLRKMARSYLYQFNALSKPKVRFDILCVYLIPGCAAEFQHIKSAFSWNERDRYADRY